MRGAFLCFFFVRYRNKSCPNHQPAVCPQRKRLPRVWCCRLFRLVGSLSSAGLAGLSVFTSVTSGDWWVVLGLDLLRSWRRVIGGWICGFAVTSTTGKVGVHLASTDLKVVFRFLLLAFPLAGLLRWVLLGLSHLWRLADRFAAPRSSPTDMVVCPFGVIRRVCLSRLSAGRLAQLFRTEWPCCR